MKVLQLIYTSCKKGLSSGTGFQTFAMSAGITDEERHEIERYGLYVPPTNLPTQPSEAEILALFPVALRFFRLQSGRFGICQSRYIGKDYSGRYGNYFSHALILEQGYFPIYPIQFYNSPLFKNGLTDSECDLTITPPPLPPLELDEKTIPTEINFDSIVEFINDKGITAVKDMLAAVLTYNETHRGLILCDSQTHIPYWIATLQLAFPLKLAHHLTFTTYTHDPAGLSTMISHVPLIGSRFSFSETQKKYENYIFFLENPGANVMDIEYEYIKNVDLGYTISQESLTAFHQFINLFDFNEVSKELDCTDTLFRLTQARVTDLSPENITVALNFAIKYADQGVLCQLSDSIDQISDDLGNNADFKTAELITRFLFRIARQNSTDRKYLETAYRFFFKALDHLINHLPHPNLEATTAFYTHIQEKNKEHQDEFAKQVLSVHRLQFITQIISNSPTPALCAQLYFIPIAGTIINSDYKKIFIPSPLPAFKAYLDCSFAALILSDEHLKEALAATVRDKEFFVQLMAYILIYLVKNEENKMRLLDSYITVMATEPNETAVPIRLDLLRKKHHSFIYDEYTHLLDKATDKPQFFQNYTTSIFKKDTDFLKEWYSKAIQDYLDHLGDKEKYKECEKLLDDIDCITDPEVVQQIIQGFEAGLPLLPPEDNKFPKLITVMEIKKKRKITTTPDVLNLIKLGKEFETTLATPTPEKIRTLVKPNFPLYNLEQLSLQRVTEYFAWCSPYLLRLVKTVQDHETLFQWFGNSKMDRSFVLKYIAEIFSIIKEDDSAGLEILLSFFKFYLLSFINDPQYQIVWDKSRGELVKILSKLSKSQLENLNAKLLKSSVTQEKKAKTELDKIFALASETHESSILGRIFGFFRKEEKKVRVVKAYPKEMNIKKNRR